MAPAERERKMIMEKLSDNVIREVFPDIWKYLEDPDVTDLDFNCGNLWLSTVSEIPKKIYDEKLDKTCLENFSVLIGKSANCNFNPTEHTAISDTETLRITCVHESQSRSGISVNIRKSHGGLRISRESALENGYCSEAVMNMLENCVQARKSMIFCGLPGWGKTEGVKLFASTISKHEKVISIEDVGEIHYPVINPGASCSELKVMKGNYKEQLETALRMNAQWILFGEIRGREAKYALESWSNGIPLMTTIHTADAGTVPDRILNMLNDRQDSDRIVNQLYNDIGISILIKRRTEGNGKVRRHIDQAAFYSRRDNVNSLAFAVEDGILYPDRIPRHVRTKIEEDAGCDLFMRCTRRED